MNTERSVPAASELCFPCFACTGAFGSRIQTAIPIAVVGSAYVSVVFFVLLLCIVPTSVAFNFSAASWQALKDLVLLPPRSGVVQRTKRTHISE